MKFDCEKCGKIDEAEFDGYPFGDRLLEGVKFVARKNDDGTCEVRPKGSDDEAYLGTLNKKMWLDRAKTFAEAYDIFTCPTCGGDAVPDDMLA